MRQGGQAWRVTQARLARWRRKQPDNNARLKRSLSPNTLSNMQGPIICANCGTVSPETRPNTSGNLFFDILDLFFFWFFYAPVTHRIWLRHRPRCPQCGSRKVMELMSPAGYETQRRFARL
jgi:hypothetical protein